MKGKIIAFVLGTIVGGVVTIVNIALTAVVVYKNIDETTEEENTEENSDVEETVETIEA